MRIIKIVLVFSYLLFSSFLSQAQQEQHSIRSVNSEKQNFAVRTHDFDVIKYYLKINLPMESIDFSGSNQISFISNKDHLSNIEIHSFRLTIDSILTDEGEKLNFSNIFSSLNVKLNMTMMKGDTSKVNIFYRSSVNNLLGFFFYQNNAFTISEPWYARLWMPCYDEPWDKATWECEITVPENYKAVSNGILIENINNPDSTITFHWKEDHLLTTYLMAFSVGEYTILKDWYIQNGDSIPILNYVFPEDLEKAKIDLKNIPEMMGFFSNIFDEPYPFDKYGHAEVTFMGAGMEHSSITTLGSKWIDGIESTDNIFAHELAHQWFGDLVTCLDFKNIWLNEGCATYFESLWERYKYGEDKFLQELKLYTELVIKSDNEFRYAIYDPPTEKIFGTIEYGKAAYVLHMLRNLVGEECFWEIIHEHLNRFKWGNIDTEDFIRISEEISGQDLTWFFDQWIYKAGLPKLKYLWHYQENEFNYSFYLNIEQVQESSFAYILPLDVKIVFNDNSATTKSIIMTEQIQDFEFSLEKLPADLIINPDLKVLTDIDSTSTDISDEEHNSLHSKNLRLLNPYPNPVNINKNQQVSIQFILSEPSDVQIKIYNILGQEIYSSNLNNLPPNIYIKKWNCRNRNNDYVSSGIYFIRISVKESTEIRKVILVR